MKWGSPKLAISPLVVYFVRPALIFPLAYLAWLAYPIVLFLGARRVYFWVRARSLEAPTSFQRTLIILASVSAVAFAIWALTTLAQSFLGNAGFIVSMVAGVVYTYGLFITFFATELLSFKRTPSNAREA
jgi:hypothetical protein